MLTNSKNPNPGPGNYSPTTKASKLSAPKYGFGSEPKNKKTVKYDGPSPNSYEIKDSVVKKNFQSTGMGYGKKVDPAQVLVDTPGPGSYVIIHPLIFLERAIFHSGREEVQHGS